MANRRRVSFVAIKKEMKAAHTQAKKALQKKDRAESAGQVVAGGPRTRAPGKDETVGAFQPMFINF